VTRGAAVCLLALGAFGCGGRAHDGARSEQRDKHELLLLDALGQPAAQAQALIADKLVTTDDEGRAELGELPASYDAVIVVGSSVLAYQGLHARSPTIEFPNSYLGSNEHGANIGILKPTTTPKQQMYFAVGVTGEGISRQTIGSNGDDKSSWAIIWWAGPSDVSLSAQAFLADMDPKTGSVLGYSGFASKAWSNAGQQNDVDWTPEFEVPPFKTKTIHVELTLPPDVSVGWYSVTLHQPSGEIGPIGTAFAGPSADLVVPDLPGATFDIFALLYGQGSDYQVQMHDVSAGSAVRADGANSPKQLTPEDGLTDVTPKTNFSWSAQLGFVYELLAFADSNEQPYTDYLVATTATSARLPDASALGVPFPSNLSLRWMVRSERGPASVDDYAAAPNTATGTGFSDFRSFTTAP
jgi:hypothetical protein